VTVSYPTHGGTNWDSALKNYIDDVKADRTARTQHAPAFGLYFPEAEGAVFDGSSDDHTPIQNAFNAAAAAGAGNTVQFPPNKTAFVQSTVTIPAGVNAVGEYGTSILVTNANIKIFTLSVGAGPTIEGLWFKGSLPAGSAGDSAFSSQMGIFYTGDPSNRVTDVTVRRCKFDNFHGVGVQIIHGQDIHVERCLLNQYAAGGVWFTSVIRGSCHRNTFIGTGQLYLTTTFCYAFTATTQISTTGGNAGLVTDSINPKSRNIEVTDNIVTNQAWECLDTHLGDQITFSRNQCYGPGAGIAVVGNDNAPMFSPVNITVTDNIVKCDLTAASNGGIALIGAKYDATANGGTGNAARERVTGTVSNNRLYGCMIDDQTSSGALNVSHSTGVTVVGNTLEACRSIGFYIRDAQDTTLIGNTIIDLWRTSAASQAFYVLKDDVNFTIDMIGNVMGTNGLSKPNINTTAVGGTSDAGIVLRMTSNRLTGAVNSTMTKGHSVAAAVHENGVRQHTSEQLDHTRRIAAGDRDGGELHLRDDGVCRLQLDHHCGHDHRLDGSYGCVDELDARQPVHQLHIGRRPGVSGSCERGPDRNRGWCRCDECGRPADGHCDHRQHRGKPDADIRAERGRGERHKDPRRVVAPSDEGRIGGTEWQPTHRSSAGRSLSTTTTSRAHPPTLGKGSRMWRTASTSPPTAWQHQRCRPVTRSA
jgi:parallel beta-helix repeat protein